MRSGRVLVGFVLLVAGLAWILDLAGYHFFPGGFGTWWPLLLVLLGLAQIASGPWGWMGGSFLVVLGGLLQLWRLGKIGGDWWMILLATVVVFAGVAIVTAPWRRARWRAWQGERWRRWDGAGQHGAVFSNVRRAIEGEFTGDRVSSVFGRLDLDMTRATLPPDGATLRLESVFGHVELRVPAAWRVLIHGTPVAGRIEDHTRGGGTGPTLTIEGQSVFGNVEVRN